MRARGFSDSDILGVVSEMEKQRKDAARQANADRQKRFRDRNAVTPVTRVTRDSVTPVTEITRDSVTEAVPYKDNSRADAVIPVGNLTVSSSLENKQEKPNPSGLSKAERKPQTRKISLAEDAQPSDADKGLADQAGLSQSEFREEWRAFRDFHCSRGNLMKNWHLAWSTWLRNSKKFNSRAGPAKQKKYGFLDDLKAEIQERQANGNTWKFNEESTSSETGREGVINADYRVIE
jgi:hypothetical protein